MPPPPSLLQLGPIWIRLCLRNKHPDEHGKPGQTDLGLYSKMQSPRVWLSHGGNNLTQHWLGNLAPTAISLAAILPLSPGHVFQILLHHPPHSSPLSSHTALLHGPCLWHAQLCFMAGRPCPDVNGIPSDRPAFHILRLISTLQRLQTDSKGKWAARSSNEWYLNRML